MSTPPLFPSTQPSTMCQASALPETQYERRTPPAQPPAPPRGPLVHRRPVRVAREESGDWKGRRRDREGDLERLLSLPVLPEGEALVGSLVRWLVVVEKQVESTNTRPESDRHISYRQVGMSDRGEGWKGRRRELGKGAWRAFSPPLRPRTEGNALVG